MDGSVDGHGAERGPVAGVAASLPGPDGKLNLGVGRHGKGGVHGQVAAISVGICKGAPVIDLDYAEDSCAETDMNVVMNDAKGFIEVQGTAEGHALQRNELDALLELAAVGIERLLAAQAAVLAK